MIQDSTFNYYELVRLTFGDIGFDTLDEIFEYLESKARAKGFELNIEIDEAIIEDNNLLKGLPYNPKSIFALLYQSLKVFSSEYLDFFGGKLPFVLTKDFNSLTGSLAKELNLSEDQKNKLKETITNYSANRWLEKKFRTYGQAKKELESSINELPEEIRKDLEQIIKKYQNRYKSIEIYTRLLELQNKFNQELKSIITKGLKEDLERLNKLPPEFINLPTSRPTSPSYDQLLLSLRETVINEKGFYIPAMVKILNALKKDHPDSLGDFEINSESIRIKLSKLRTSPK